MQDVEFSDAFCRFIKAVVPAVDAAELLLVFHARPDASLSVAEALAKLGPGIAAAETEKYLQSFVAAGLLAAQEGKYRYQPAAPDAGHVDTLAQAYVQRPVTLVRVIYALRDSKIQTFADAFKLRK